MLKKASWICRHYDSSTYELSDILPFSGDGIRDACSKEACLVGHWEENRIMNIAQSSRAELELANREGQAESRSERQNSATAFFQPTHQAHYLRQKILTLTSNSKDYTNFLASIADYRYCAQILQICILPQLATTKNSNRRRISRHAPRCANTANMSLTNCRFYEEKYPEIDSFVMVNVKQVSPSRDIWEV
jgi:hypothetical protein